MSLAEPRKRRKNPMHNINLSAPNHWTNDDSKFGQRMLEKFGWSKGSGLGKNQQGIADNIKVQHKITTTGLGFIAHNADDWFKAGEDYAKLLSQLTEKFEEYQALSETNNEANSKKSLVENSLNSRSRVHYHKFTKGKDLTQYKKEELECILGKGVKDDYQSSNNLNMKEYFKIKQESRKSINNNDKLVIEDSTSEDDEFNKIITAKECKIIKSDEYEINIIPSKKKKSESKLLKKNKLLQLSEPKLITLDYKKKKSEHNLKKNDITQPPNLILNDKIEKNMENNLKVEEFKQNLLIDKRKKNDKNKKEIKITVNLKEQNSINAKKEKKISTVKDESNIDECNFIVQSKKKKKESKTLNNDIEIKNDNISNNNKISDLEQEPETVNLTYKYQNFVDLLIENSSAGKKFCKDPSSPLFKKRMKEFSDDIKKKYPTTTTVAEIKHIEETTSKPVILNPDSKNFTKDFDDQKFKILQSITKRQEAAKYINEKSMFIAQHGDILFYGSNINDIKGYGDW